MRRPALVVSAVLALLFAGLVGVLATRDPASQRLVRSPLVGKVRPALIGDQLLAGGEYDAADDDDRWLLVNFFATWCTPCKEEHDDLVRFAAAHPRDVRVVSVVSQDDPDTVRAFFRSRGGDWPVLADDDGGIAASWGLIKLPESYLVAPGGQVVAKIVGGVRSADLENLLAEAAG